jgi:hypothetical protein
MMPNIPPDHRMKSTKQGENFSEPIEMNIANNENKY